ncbi:BQ5605_C010g05908 [Microbotryum silenes-dioicae]|uniref:BQ5605_C010g05908 protein n=1 Tax=Microbotryum silenes-dioicae TaxID=796604 RepID=A0A2X0LTC1_9BASI|nr:BQ5605_C010g05908 [Microbotryum silenes-dioicae]
MPPRIRKVLFDAFGTLFSPRTPVANQYADVARLSDLNVDPEQVKQGFKIAYKHWAKTHPVYGRCSTPPLDPTLWWSGLIQDTFHHAGVTERVESILTKTLIERFWCAEGYSLHDDVLPAFQRLGALSQTPDPSLRSPHFGVVSGSDPGVIKVLRSLGLLVDEGHVLVDGRSEFCQENRWGIKEDEIFTTWAVGKEKNDVQFWEDVLEQFRVIEGKECEAKNFLVVGDELVNDYMTPRKLGFQCLLLRRPLDEQARMTIDDEVGQEDGVESVRSLVEVANWIERRHTR